MKSLICLVLSFYPFNKKLYAQVSRCPVYTSIAVYSSQQVDAFSFAANQAALASIHHFAAGVFAERIFFLEDLTQYQAAIALTTGSGNFGFRGAFQGNPQYAEASFGLAYARTIGKADIGVQFNYYRLGVAGYGHASSVNIEGGFIIHFTSKLNGGMHVYNPTGAHVGHNDERLPVIVGAGFGYDLSSLFYIGAGFEKEENLPVAVRVGFHYAFTKKIFLRAGISSSGALFFFGLGFTVGDFRIDATASLHPQLGTTPGLLFLYNHQKE
jgi:hypothetical protein